MREKSLCSKKKARSLIRVQCSSETKSCRRAKWLIWINRKWRKLASTEIKLKTVSLVRGVRNLTTQIPDFILLWLWDMIMTKLLLKRLKIRKKLLSWLSKKQPRKIFRKHKKKILIGSSCSKPEAEGRKHWTVKSARGINKYLKNKWKKYKYKRV